jgi:predicted RNase H-like HicB family nuclease
MMEARFAVILAPEPDGSAFNVLVPSLPEAHTWGETREAALANAQEVIALCLEQRREDGETLPAGDAERTKLEVVSVDLPAA